MKGFLFFFLFLGQTIASQSLLEQKIDFKVNEVPIAQAILELAFQSETDIAFSKSFFKNDAPVSINIKNQSLNAILTQLLKNTPVAYKELEGRVVLFRVKQKKCTISGYIEDNISGERLINATVFCPALNKGTVTNEYGFYSISLPQTKTQMEYSYLGYEKKTEFLSLTADKHLDVALRSRLTLSEVLSILPLKTNHC